MYSLDINFLKDRAERQSAKGVRQRAVVRDDPRPIYIGGAVGLALLALAGGAWLLLQNQNRTLAQQSAELDNQLAALRIQQGEVNSINQQVQAIEAQNQALATVFDQIRPWSAILQDIRSRVPGNVQIQTIEQVEAAPVAVAPSPSPSPAASPSPGASPSPEASPQAAAPPPPAVPRVRITGQARSFNDVNDFVLTLQRSPFLDREDVRLVGSRLVDNATQIEFSGQQQQGNSVEVRLPQVVEYTIESNLTSLPASELLRDLERTLSVGLASRIQALRDRGVLQP